MRGMGRAIVPARQALGPLAHLVSLGGGEIQGSKAHQLYPLPNTFGSVIIVPSSKPPFFGVVFLVRAYFHSGHCQSVSKQAADDISPRDALTLRQLVQGVDNLLGHSDL